MNVRELIEKLNNFEPRMRVFLEGYDGKIEVSGDVQNLQSVYNSVVIRNAFSYGREPEKKL